MNTKLLRKIQKEIIKHPTQVFIHDWFSTGRNIRGCGTAGCIGGWAIAIHKKITLKKARQLTKTNTLDEVAASILELNFHQAARLFLYGFWPVRYSLYDASTGKEYTPKKYAQIISDRIDNFIETEGNE